jgi:hypothetical protein
LRYLKIFTANHKWEKDFVTKEDICNKTLKIKDLSVFLNFDKDILYDDIMEDLDIESLDEDVQEEMRKMGDTSGDMKMHAYRYFLSDECQSQRVYSYIIDNFGMETHLKLNKAPKQNNKPQIDLNIVFGGEFSGEEETISNYHSQTFNLQLQQQQLNCLMKFLEYSSFYTKFQSYVLRPIVQNRFSKYHG